MNRHITQLRKKKDFVLFEYFVIVEKSEFSSVILIRSGVASILLIKQILNYIFIDKNCY